MEIYQIADVVSLLGLPGPVDGRSSYYVTCPCCDESPKRRHMNINLKKNVFRCPRCGVYGGIFDLYSLYTGVPKDRVREELNARLGHVEPSKQRSSAKPAIHEYPLTDIETRHATYSALLSMLSLAPDHREKLLKRGLTDADIERLGYKTTPVIGASAIAKQLLNAGYYLAGVPGFYRDNDDNWTFVQEKRGILIPARNMGGQIQGLKIRRDDVSKGKFRWISSIEKKDGCQAKGWTHLAGPVCREILITEGPMKADIVNTLTGRTVLAVPGVNGLTQLEETLTLLREAGLQKIKTAFDMDYFANYHVQAGYENLLALLGHMGFQYGTYLWDPRFKGLDDYIWEYQFQMQNKEMTSAVG